MSTKTRVKIGLVCLVILVLGISRYWWVRDEPRRESLATLTLLDSALHSGGGAALQDLVVLPGAIRDRTVPEQREFLAKALNDEISAEGLAELKRHAAYGPLKKLFPTEAESWAAQAGLKPEDCVAFKMERNGLRAEVVLRKPALDSKGHRTSLVPYRIIRVNNVKQMADSTILTTEKTQ